MTFDDVKTLLGEVRINYSIRKSPEISSALAALKERAVLDGEDDAAEELCCHEQILTIQECYLKAFAQMKTGEYYEAWCVLEKAENTLSWLLTNYPKYAGCFELRFICATVPRLQSLFPYKYFISPEFLIRTKRCSICEKNISIRNPCGHRVGGVYKGKICHREVSDIEVLGTAIVANPSQKYSVVFLSDPATKERKDQYNYSVVQYLISRLAEPFDGWSHEVTKRRHPHSRYSFVGRNEKCPCESGMKYKKCCLLTDGVLRPHIQFTFQKKPL